MSNFLTVTALLMATVAIVLSERKACRLPADPGRCRAAFERWYYNKGTKKCEKFVYGGCGGNENNFESQLDCELKCGHKEACRLPADPGRCKAAFGRWYYNKGAKKCEKFVYGGCGGNENNFERQLDCELKCGHKDVCKLPSETGPCDAFFPKWFYNAKTKTCEEFIYGGCGGNVNRFESKEECDGKCGLTTAEDARPSGTSLNA